jgi:hypothetical protein
MELEIDTQKITQIPLEYTFNCCYIVLNIVEYTWFMSATVTLFA